MSSQVSMPLVGESFVRCARCGYVRHLAQMHAPADRWGETGRLGRVCIFCVDPERFKVAHPIGDRERRARG